MPIDVDENGQIVYTEDVPQLNAPAPVGTFPAPEQSTPYTDELISAISGFKLPTVNAQIPGTQPVTPTPGSSGSGQSFSASHSGVDMSNGGLFDQVQTKGMRGFNKAVAEGQNRANAYGAALSRGRAENIDEQRAASDAIGEQEALKAEENARLTNEMATREREMAVDNAKDYAAIQTKVAGKMADYENAVNELSVMGVNPGRMYSNLTDPTKAGVLVTAFVTDFLGAKGIKTHGMDYINQAIERDIQSQRDAIDLKKDVVQGKMNIYKMFKEQGDSDYLAAEKTRGALFKAFHTEVMGKLAAFDSPLVRAKMQQADALLKEKKLNTDAEILKATQDQFNKEYDNAVQLRGQDLSAAAARNSLAESRRQFDATLDAKGAGKDAVDPERVMYNTEGKPMGYVSKEDNFEKVAESVTAIQGMTDILGEYASAIQRSGRKYGGPGSAAFEGDVEVARKSLEGQLTAQIAKMNNPDGKISDNDIAAAKAILSSPGMISGLLSGEDPVQAAIKNTGGYGRRAIKQHHDYLKVHLRQITDEEAAALRPGGARAGTTGIVDAKGTNFGVMERGDFGRAAPETPTDKAVGKLSNETGEEQNSYVSIADDKDGSLAEYWMPHIAGGMRNEVAGTEWGKASLKPENAKAPRWLGALDDLYDKARESNSAERDTAVNALWEQTKNPDPDISGAAQYYIDKLPTVFSSPDPWDK